MFVTSTLTGENVPPYSKLTPEFIISIVDRRDEISFRNRSLLISFVVNIEIPALVGSGLVHATSFMGFIGGLRENVCLLRWYQKATYALLGLDVLFMAMCFAVPFVSRSDIFHRVAQESFMCCGVTRNRYRDWDQNIYFNCSKSNPSAERCSVPASCCRPITVLKNGGEVDPEVRLRRRFCGKGVLAISEQRAWEKVFTRSCVDAFVAYIRSNITIMIGACLVTFAVVALLRSMASTVCGEIISLTDLYNKYYRNVAKGYRQSLRRRQALQAEARAKDLMVMEMTKPEQPKLSKTSQSTIPRRVSALTEVLPQPGGLRSSLAAGKEEQEPTHASTSVNTWLVYLFLHLETVFMAASLVVFVVASIGFLGALRQNVTLLDMYSTLQGAFVTAELVFIILAFFLPLIGREFVISHITTELIVHYRDNTDYRNEIDYVQSTLRCCGMTENAYRDWNANAYFNCSPTNPSAERCSVPASCCRRPDKAGIGLDDDFPPTTQNTGVEGKGNKKENTRESGNVEDETVMTTLCGRGVMKLNEQEAWKRIYTRGCGPAVFHYVESRVVEIVLFTLLVILTHLMLMSLSVNVRKEITALGKVYDKYYKVPITGSDIRL
ncbi:hypothetical protein V5799_033173 [Amblyomma americanum]|uniref:Tetraspanin n=1 Tax=Amblyomma americanum TaxID=6943 RepID=A0AAQ4DP28_AMBAM